MDALHGAMAAHAHGVRSTVRMPCNTAAISEYLPPLLGPFLAAHPQIDVDCAGCRARTCCRPCAGCCFASAPPKT